MDGVINVKNEPVGASSVKKSLLSGRFIDPLASLFLKDFSDIKVMKVSLFGKTKQRMERVHEELLLRGKF